MLQVICMYNMSTLNNYPESIGLQLCQKLLVYYGRCDLITKFIDECDVKSLKHCALVPVFQCTPLSNVRTRTLHNFFKPILANQYLKIKEVNLTADFFLCSKSIFIWVWSLKQDEKSKIIGEISLPDKYEDICFLKMFNQYGSDKYEILLGNTKQVINIEDNGKEKWCLNLSEVDRLKQISIVGDRAFLLIYENQNYIDLYDFQKHTLIERKIFGSKVTFLKTNRSNKYGWDSEKGYKIDLFIAIGLEDSTLSIFQVLCDFNNKEETKIEFKEIYKRRFINYTLISGLFELFKTKNKVYSENFKFRFIASLNELRCILIELKDDGTLNVKGLKAQYSEIEDQDANLSLISFKHNIATFQFGKNLHLYFEHYKQWYKIPGVYSYVSLNKLDTYTILCGIYKTELNIFLIQNEQNNYKVAHLVKNFQFPDEIFDVGILSGL